MYTVQSRKQKNNMIGKTNPIDHKKPVNRKKRTVIGSVNKVHINSENEKIEVRLTGANRAGKVGFILRKYTRLDNALNFCKVANSVKRKNV